MNLERIAAFNGALFEIEGEECSYHKNYTMAMGNASVDSAMASVAKRTPLK